MTARGTLWTGLLPLTVLLAGLLLLSSSVLAEDGGEEGDDQPEGDGSDGGEGGDDQGQTDQAPAATDDLMTRYTNRTPKFGEYGRWLQHYEKMALGLDLWGGSATVPQGFLVAVVGWGTMRPYARFDNNRKQTTLLPVLRFEDPFHYGGDFFKFTFGLSGSANGYAVAAMYGVTDTLTVGVSTMAMDLEINIEPILKPGTCDRLGVASVDDFYTILEQLGHPRPVHHYKSDPLDWGDTTVEATWNYYRGSWFSTAIKPRVILPTAHEADPNENMIFINGPDTDTGAGTWGFGMGIPLDFKPPKPLNVVGISLSAEGAYFLPDKRRSPDFLPINQDVRDWLEAQGMEVDLFQNLTDLDDYYTFQPGPWVAASIGIGAGPLGISYRHGWAWEAHYKSNSEGFDNLIDYIGLVGNGDDGKLSFNLSIPLTPLYIPAVAQLRMDYVTDGRNALIWRDSYQAGLGLFIPIAPPERYRYKGGDK